MSTTSDRTSRNLTKRPCSLPTRAWASRRALLGNVCLLLYQNAASTWPAAWPSWTCEKSLQLRCSTEPAPKSERYFAAFSPNFQGVVLSSRLDGSWHPGSSHHYWILKKRRSLLRGQAPAQKQLKQKHLSLHPPVE